MPHRDGDDLETRVQEWIDSEYRAAVPDGRGSKDALIYRDVTSAPVEIVNAIYSTHFDIPGTIDHSTTGELKMRRPKVAELCTFCVRVGIGMLKASCNLGTFKEIRKSAIGNRDVAAYAERQSMRWRDVGLSGNTTRFQVPVLDHRELDEAQGLGMYLRMSQPAILMLAVAHSLTLSTRWLRVGEYSAFGDDMDRTVRGFSALVRFKAASLVERMTAETWEA